MNLFFEAGADGVWIQ